MKTYIAEFLGTFALLFAGTGAIIINDVAATGTTGGPITHIGIAVSFGLVVMSVIYAIGDVSGAHINPAVTIAFYVARRFPGNKVAPYILSQMAGALAASGLLRLMFGAHETMGATLPAGSELQSFLLEIILTWFLMFVILGVTTGAKEKGILAGIAIGGVIALEALFAGPISGASMNPARSIAPAVVSGNLSSLWLYIVAPILGACLGVLTCRCIEKEGCCATPCNS